MSVGGYASAPMAVASIASRIPLVLLEQNTRPGLTNRLFWRFARKVCVGFADATRYFSPAKVSVTGNPVRANFSSGDPLHCERPIQILVLGGSSGAHRLNLGILNSGKIWGNRVINARILHQTGEADVALVREGYHQLALDAQVTPFIDDVPAALAAADLVIARAGAMTVTEIALAGRPAVFVPYPFHRDLQQVHNARVMERADAAIIVLDDDHLPENLSRELSMLLADRARLRAMGRRARGVIEPGAAARIAKICFDIVDSERKAA
ncbi:MAG: UDP-N-acetylglucosamine--N-acetylmuramyl-(pentapeptide) pyrophosphoryl-undecaprenol N-acetylglucosamine transferase [Candidatus Binataceae bacterium]